MSRTPAVVLAELLALSPAGDALPLDGSGNWPQMLMPLATEISRFESFAEEMLIELIPARRNICCPIMSGCWGLILTGAMRPR